MDSTSSWQSAEYDSWFVPYHQEVLSAHQSHFCLRVIAEDGGFQSDVSWHTGQAGANSSQHAPLPDGPPLPYALKASRSVRQPASPCAQSSVCQSVRQAGRAPGLQSLRL